MKRYYNHDDNVIYTENELKLMYKNAVLRREISKEDYSNFQEWIDCQTDMGGCLSPVDKIYCVICRSSLEGIITVKMAGREIDAEWRLKNMFRDFINECEEDSYDVIDWYDNQRSIRLNSENEIITFTIEEIEED